MAAAFRCRLGDYEASSAFEKIGHLIAASARAGFSTHHNKQTDAWKAELETIASAAAELRLRVPGSENWWLLLEYEIPRREKRPDAILLADDVVFVVEFKIGQQSFSGADEWQVYSYALDLRDFHAASRNHGIAPVLVATAATSEGLGDSAQTPGAASPSQVLPVRRTNAPGLGECLRSVYESLTHDPAQRIDPHAWEHSAYRPTPTIIEAAEQLFAGHSVSDISHAFATNLDATSEEIVRAIKVSQAEKRRTICFVTGIPGAGKTLAGLNAVHSPSMRTGDRPPAVFLSGNGPLVKIVKEALIRDRCRDGMPRGDAARVVSTFIANVHGFLALYGIREVLQAPAEHAIVFDEAQRAWTAEAVRKKHSVSKSEPTLILDIMARAADWCTIVALVGSGQEIHRGEAGLEEWGRALNDHGVPWRVLVSPLLLEGRAEASARLFDSARAPHLEIVPAPALDLAVSVRSPRARLLREWVDGLLENRSIDGFVADGMSEFPIAMTRDLELARNWLKEHGDCLQRAGLLASSGALRLRPHGIEVSAGFRQGYSYADWFLSGPEDTRSSARLEVAATEFECQGLEVDWSGVCWGDDLLIDPRSGSWACRQFRGTKWQRVSRPEQRRYILNKYRVLLTRARRGMVIWIPRGDSEDATRDPRLLDATAEYLRRSGIPLV